MAFCRRLARVSALLQTPPESLAGSPGLFESPSEEEVGQTAPKIALLSRSFHLGSWRRGLYFFGNRGLSKRLFTVSRMGLSRIFLTTFLAGSGICISARI